MIAGLALLSSPLGAQPAAARNTSLTLLITRYVSTSGVDTGACDTLGSPCATLNYAISQATAGEIIGVATGTYSGSGTEVVLVGKDLTLTGGWDAAFSSRTGLSTVDGEGARRGIVVNSGVIAVVDHFAVQNGFHSTDGAGIYNEGSLTLSGSTLTGNVSHWKGGGISSKGALTVSGSLLNANSGGQTSYTNVGGGAAISVESPGSLVVSDTTIAGNLINGNFAGSAISAQNANVELNSVTVSSNTGSMAIALSRVAPATSMTVAINNSTVSGNTGGVWNVGAAVLLSNSTIAYNTSFQSGASVAGVQNVLGYSGTMTLRNTIVALNGDPGGVTDCQGPLTSAGYNLIGENTGCTLTPSTGDQVGTTANPIDPRLGVLQNNGGPAFTHALLGTSPALNSGNPAAPGSGGDACLGTDQRGIGRTTGICDIGAFEAEFPAVQSITPADPNPTGAFSVNFTVIFSKPVSGVDMTDPFDDFALTTTGSLAASIASVTGSDDIYTVTVTTATGLGTVRLDLIDRDTITDGSGTPLGGTGLNNADFDRGVPYTINAPKVSAIALASASLTRAASVRFNVGFSRPVVGLDKVAPFSDFVLTTKGLSGASITSISGSGASYAVFVNTGSGNGTLRLDLIDHNTIADPNGRLLGGDALGDGTFKKGGVYTVQKTPAPQLPAGAIWDTTPAYKWLRVPGATQFRYELRKGTALVYTKTLAASACAATTCTNTPTTVLAPAAYQWHVQALIGGAWQAYTPYKSFTLYAPKAGYWSDPAHGFEFFVARNRMQVDNFAVYFTVTSCSTSVYKVTNLPLVPISKTGTFSIVNAFWANGTFSKSSTSPSSASGQGGLNNYYVLGCGYVNGGPWTWNALWRNTNQPAGALSADQLPNVILLPMLEAPPEFAVLKASTVQP